MTLSLVRHKKSGEHFIVEHDDDGQIERTSLALNPWEVDALLQGNLNLTDFHRDDPEEDTLDNYIVVI